MSKLTPYSLTGITDPHMARVLQDMVDRTSFLEGEIERLRSMPSQLVGMAKAESPIEGIITIPYRDHGGRDGSVRVSRDGVVVSYVNPVESFFPYVNTTIVGNIGLGVDPLHSVLIPANSLAANGDYIKVVQGGEFATNDDQKRLDFSLDGQVFDTTGLTDFDGLGWIANTEYTRISPTSIRVCYILTAGHIHFNSAGTILSNFGYRVVTRNGLLTNVANLNNNGVILLVQGETDVNVNANVMQNLTIIELYKPGTFKSV